MVDPTPFLSGLSLMKVGEHVNPAELAVKLASWLVSEEVVRNEATLAGGVAGWINLNGRPEGLYPEIAGYHLQFLAAAQAAGADPAHATLAKRVVTWIDAISRDGPPYTLYRLC